MKGGSHPTPPASSSRRSSLPFADLSLDQGSIKEPQDDAILQSDPGTLKVGESGTSYVQSVHWEAILTKIKGLKEDLVTDSRSPPGSYLFYGLNRHASRDEILRAIPPRTVVDRLMALQLSSNVVTPCQYGQSFVVPQKY